MESANQGRRAKQRSLPPPLLAFVNLVFLPLKVSEASSTYRSQFRRSVRFLESILERPATLRDLTTANLKTVQFAETDKADGLGAQHRVLLRRRLRSIWAYAAELGYLDPPPRNRKAKPKRVRVPKEKPVRTPPEPGTLGADLEAMLLETAIDPSTADQYRIAIRSYGRFLGRDAIRSDLDELTVNRWLQSLEGRKSPRTIHGRKRNLTPLWNWLAGQNLVSYYNPRRLRRTRFESRPVQAWSIDQVKALLAGAGDVKGRPRCGVSIAPLLRALILVAFDTGLRPGDLRRIESHSIDLERRAIAIVQNKTGNPHTAVINQRTIDALNAIDFQSRSRVFPMSKDAMRRWLDLLYEAAAKHGFSRRKGQNIGTLRKSHATERARTEGVEAAARSLGHVSGTRTALRHYIAAEAIAPLGAMTCIESLERELDE